MEHIAETTMDDSESCDDVIDHHEAENSSTISVDATAEDASMAVVELVAALEDVATSDLEPLFRTLDPEAFDSLYESLASGEADGRLTLRYEGYDVVVDTDGTITARPIDDAAEHSGDAADRSENAAELSEDRSDRSGD
jgi:hypothetical protein